MHLQMRQALVPFLFALLCLAPRTSISDDSAQSPLSSLVPEHLFGQLGLRIQSPLEGEWLHEQSCKALVEVWAPDGYNWSSAVQVLVNWHGGTAYVPIPLKEWESFVVNPAWSSSPVPSDSLGKNDLKFLKAESLVQLMPSEDMWDHHESGQMSLFVTASLMRLDCSESCEILRATAPFTLVHSWGEVLAEINDNPSLAGSMVGRPASAGRAWPPSGLVINSPKTDECVEGPTLSLGFSFVGAHIPDDRVEVLLNGKVVEQTGVWEREINVFGLQRGTNCISLRHTDRASSPISSTTSPVVCFTVGSRAADGLLNCAKREAEQQEARPTVLMVTWMPPVHHVTGMSERLWQVAEKLLRAGRSIEVASVMCSHNRRDTRAELHPQIRLVACGRELLAGSVLERIALSSAARHVIVASWWFGHPSPRSQPEQWLPVLRDLRPELPVAILVDDLFVPFPFPYNGTVPGDQTSLLAVCGAQTIALAAADAVGTLTEEDAAQLRALLPAAPLPVLRVRYSLSGDALPPAPAPFAARLPRRRLLYAGSCHAANEAALRWLLEETLPLFADELSSRGEDPRDWTLSIVGDVTPQTCAPTLCRGGVCEAEHLRGIAVRFEGYVASLEAVMDESLVFVAPRLAGLGLSTKLMLGLERGLPAVTTPHGTTGYNISDWSGPQGVLVAEHSAQAEFAAAMAALASTEALWTLASEGGRRHAYGQFRPEQQQADVELLLAAASEHRQQATDTA